MERSVECSTDPISRTFAEVVSVEVREYVLNGLDVTISLGWRVLPVRSIRVEPASPLTLWEID